MLLLKQIEHLVELLQVDLALGLILLQTALTLGLH